MSVLQSKRGCGSTELQVTVSQPIPSGLMIRYAKILSRSTAEYIAHHPHPELRKEWKILGSEPVKDSVFFAFSSDLFGASTRRCYYFDSLLVWYERDGRTKLEVIPIPTSSKTQPWKVAVRVVEP